MCKCSSASAPNMGNYQYQKMSRPLPIVFHNLIAYYAMQQWPILETITWDARDVILEDSVGRKQRYFLRM